MRLCARAIGALIVALSIAGAFGATAEDAIVIAHPRVQEAALPRSTLQAIFSMRLTRWPDGTPVRVFVLPDDQPLHRAFCLEVLGIFPHQMRLAWDRLVFSGTGQAPVEVGSPEQMVAAVAATPGAIGYARSGISDGRLRVLPVR